MTLRDEALLRERIITRLYEFHETIEFYDDAIRPIRDYDILEVDMANEIIEIVKEYQDSAIEEIPMPVRVVGHLVGKLKFVKENKNEKI